MIGARGLHEIRIVTRVLAGACAIAASSAIAIYALPSFLGSSSAIEVIFPALAIALGALAALVVLLLRAVVMPMKEITEAIRTLAKGNFREKIYSGKITRSKVKNANELDRTILMLELMRRKVLEVKKNLNETMKQKALDLQRINDELLENEQTLKKANGQLQAQAEEFKRVNDELSKKNEELSLANSKLRQLDRMKDDFVTVAARELCIPLEPILDSVDRLERGAIAEEEAWKAIISGSRRLVGVANNILDVGRIEGGNFDYKMGPVSMRKLLDEVSSAAQTGQAGKDAPARLIIDMDPNGDVMMAGDRKRLVQAFSAIISNSAAFSKRIPVKVQVRADLGDGSVKIRIIDDGPPFPGDVLPVLFDKYAARAREDERGTGLGLFISRTIVEAHGGSIGVENNASDKGVTFTISLPTRVKKKEEVSQLAQA